MKLGSAGKDPTASFGSILFLVDTEASKWVGCSCGPATVLILFPSTSSDDPALGEGAKQVQRPLVRWKPSPIQNTRDAQRVWPPLATLVIRAGTLEMLYFI